MRGSEGCKGGGSSFGVNERVNWVQGELELCRRGFRIILVEVSRLGEYKVGVGARLVRIGGVRRWSR